MVRLTTIQVSEELRNKLTRYKYELGVRSLEEVIEKILTIVPSNQLNKKEESKDEVDKQNR